jgi:hypothetical protein
MASEKAEALREFLREKIGLTEPQINSCILATLGEVYTPAPKPKSRRCGASLPHPNADDGWRWCIQASGHTTPHMDEGLYAWTDGTTVEVTTVEVFLAVPDHVHDFSGDDMACSRDIECQLTWGERTAQDRKWKEGQHG